MAMKNRTPRIERDVNAMMTHSEKKKQRQDEV